MVCLSSDSEDEVAGEKKTRKKRRLPRHKDVSVIDLEAMGVCAVFTHNVSIAVKRRERQLCETW